MDLFNLLITVVIQSIVYCNGASLQEQLEHIQTLQLESRGLNTNEEPMRRYSFQVNEMSPIIGVPSLPSHLPEAEPILPGHTLIRPALGMLKSAVKFPHRDLENGAGVYGNVNNLGIRYDGTNERVLYTGFRRTPSDYILVPIKHKETKPKLIISVVDLNAKGGIKNNILKFLRKLTDISKKKHKKKYLQSFSELVRRKPKTKWRPKKNRWHKKHNKKDNKYMTLSMKHNTAENNTDNNKHRHKRWKSMRDEVRPGKPRKQHGNKRWRSIREERLQKKFPFRNQRKFLNKLSGIIESRSQEFDFSSQEGKISSMDEMILSNFSSEESTAKTQIFWDTKDAFNHVQIHPDAPEHTDLLPEHVIKKLRHWWFYNQEDYEPFSKNESS